MPSLTLPVTDILKKDIDEYFVSGKTGKKDANIEDKRNILAFIRVLDAYSVPSVADLARFPQNQHGHPHVHILATDLDVGESYLQTVAQGAKRFKTKWRAEVVRKLALSKGKGRSRLAAS